MHLWRKNNRFTFQKRIPADLVPILGASPIRIPLPPLGAREAQRLALQAAAAMDVEIEGIRRMADPTTVTREELETLLKSVIQLADETLALARRPSGAGISAPALEGLRARHTAHLESFRQLTGRDARAAEPAPKAIPAHSENADDMRAMTEQLSAFMKRHEKPTYPTFSSMIPEVLERKEKYLGENKYVKSLPGRLDAFVQIAGDKPIDEYDANDLDLFMDQLLKTPANWTKRKMFAGMTFPEMAAYNSGLRKPYETLSWKTVNEGYMRPIRSALIAMCNKHKVFCPWHDYKVVMPRRDSNIRTSIARVPFSANELNKMLVVAAGRERHDDYWMPLLAMMTGARVGELAFLHGTDVKLMGKSWYIDLSAIVTLPGGKVGRRKVKTDNAIRQIPLHNMLIATGFLDWARKTGEGALFKRLRATADPSGAASKRMNNLLKAAGVHRRQTQVLHCLRHTYKKWLEKAKVDGKIRRITMGHASKDVHEDYGGRLLDEYDIRDLCDLPLPWDLDFSPYLKDGTRIEKQGDREQPLAKFKAVA